MNSKFVLMGVGMALVSLLGACSGGDSGAPEPGVIMPGVGESPYPGYEGSGSGTNLGGNGSDQCAACVDACTQQGYDTATCEEACADYC